MTSESTLIAWQQSVADALLARLEAIDPHCIIAGGAPRDWYLGRQAKDLDVYLYIPRNSLLRHFKTQLSAIGITNIEQSTLSFNDARYINNPLVRWVFNYEKNG
jgi:tRNA nucleotidyltransferase/poly(A) polymerase